MMPVFVPVFATQGQSLLGASITDIIIMGVFFGAFACFLVLLAGRK